MAVHKGVGRGGGVSGMETEVGWGFRGARDVTPSPNTAGDLCGSRTGISLFPFEAFWVELS